MTTTNSAACWEDNAGGIYIVAHGLYYEMDGVIADGTGAVDLRAAADGDTDDWTVPTGPAHDLDTESAYMVCVAVADIDGVRTNPDCFGLAAADYFQQGRQDPWG